MKRRVVGTAVAAVLAAAPGRAGGPAAPVYGLELPAGYRDWRLLSVARVGGSRNDLRAKLGNDVAVEAYRTDKRPFPDGTTIVRLAWSQLPASEDFRIEGDVEPGSGADSVRKLLADSFVAGAATNVQVMVKDAKRFAATGGWGFAQFEGGRPSDEAVHRTCFACHEPARDRDFVFTRYAP